VNLGSSTAKPNPELWRYMGSPIRTWMIWLFLSLGYPLGLGLVLALLKAGALKEDP
jgi:hypothetical protein